LAFFYQFQDTIPSPTGLRVVKVNVTTWEVSWNPIPAEHSSGEILGYKIQLRDDYDNLLQMIKINRTRQLIKRIPVKKRFYIHVQGFTSNETLSKSTYASIYSGKYFKICYIQAVMSKKKLENINKFAKL